jgi:hypothetical protein
MCAKCLGDYHPQFTCSEYKMLGNEQVQLKFNEGKLKKA